MNAEKIYEKAEKRLTISGKCGTIFKQSAQTASHLRCPQGCANRICEGGGTGRRARLRCVWFILGGSSPLPRTRKTLRDIEENSMLRGVFFLPSCQILSDTARYCRKMPDFAVPLSENVVCCRVKMSVLMGDDFCRIVLSAACTMGGGMVC